jgi:hypothetical protein
MRMRCATTIFYEGSRLSRTGPTTGRNTVIRTFSRRKRRRLKISSKISSY